MEGSTLSFLGSEWRENVSVMKIYEDKDDMDEFSLKNYIWFQAILPEDEDHEAAEAAEKERDDDDDDEDDDEEEEEDSANAASTAAAAANSSSDSQTEDEAVLYRLRQHAAMFGAQKHLKLMEMAVGIAQAASEKTVRRAERERDDALDAVEFVTKKLLCLRDEVERVTRERDEVREACDDLLKEQERVEGVVARFAERRMEEVDATRNRIEALEEENARASKALRGAAETAERESKEKAVYQRERDEARRALTLLEQTSSSERERSRKERDSVAKERDDKTEEWYRLNATIQGLKDRSQGMEARLETLAREKDDALRSRDQLAAVAAALRQDSSDLRKERDQLRAELDYERERDDPDDTPEVAVATAVLEEDKIGGPRGASADADLLLPPEEDKKALDGGGRGDAAVADDDMRRRMEVLASERDDARADAEKSRRVVERMATELVAARGEDKKHLERANAMRRERDVLHKKLCSLVYAEPETDPAAAEAFRADPIAALGDLEDDDDDLEDDDVSLLTAPSPTKQRRHKTHRLSHPAVKEEPSPARDDDSLLETLSNDSWTTTSRAGWPPKRSKSTSNYTADDQTIASKERHGRRDDRHDLPSWIKRIAPSYSKEDFDNVRLRCVQFQAEMARAQRAALDDLRR